MLLKSWAPFQNSLFPVVYRGDIALFSTSVENFDGSIKRLNENLIKSQEEINRFGESLTNPSKIVENFWESMKQEDIFSVTTTIAGLAIGLAGLAKLNAPLAGLGAAIGIIGLNSAFLVSLLNDIEESLKAFEEQKLRDFKFPENSIIQLERLSSLLEPLTNTPDFQFRINLQDNATASGAKIRRQLEELFKPEITQTIMTNKIDGFISLSKSNGHFGNGNDSSFDGGPEFLTSSPDFTGFSDSVGLSPPVKTKIPGFASGIQRVPRDMLAMIHKDEAVLPKNQAEGFRKGGSTGMTIQNLIVNLNIPNAINPKDLDREQFRNFAFKLMGEMKRLERRVN